MPEPVRRTGWMKIFTLHGSDNLYLCEDIKHELNNFKSPRTLIAVQNAGLKFIGREIIQDVIKSCGSNLFCNKFELLMQMKSLYNLPESLTHQTYADVITNGAVNQTSICSRSHITTGTVQDILYLHHIRFNGQTNIEHSMGSSGEIPRPFNTSAITQEVNTIPMRSARFKRRPCDIYAVVYTTTASKILGDKLDVSTQSIFKKTTNSTHTLDI